MAIRFPCPSCRQPIEVDDDLARQSVGCPYCRGVVTAPADSTWPAEPVTMAKPAGGAFTPPPPPISPGLPMPRQNPDSLASTRQTSTAGWALLASLMGTTMAILAWIGWLMKIGARIQDKLGATPTRQQVEQALQEMTTSGEAADFITGPIRFFFVIGVILCLSGTLLAARSLLKKESGRVIAVLALLFGISFTCCQCMPILYLLTPGDSP